MRVGAEVDARPRWRCAPRPAGTRTRRPSPASTPPFARLPKRPGDVGERVERALRHHAAHAGHRVERLDDHAAAPVELARHLGHLVLRAGERLDRGPLRDRRGIGRDLALHVGHRLDDRAWARPRSRCASPVIAYAFEHVLTTMVRAFTSGDERGDGHVPALVGERLVALVGDDPEIALDGELRHLGERRRGENTAPVGLPGLSSTISFVRGVTARAERRGVEIEAGRLVRGHRRPARRPAAAPAPGTTPSTGSGSAPRRPGSRSAMHDVVERVLGAAGDRDLVGRVLEPVVALELVADRGAQLGNAPDLGVLGLALLDRADRGVLDARRACRSPARPRRRRSRRCPARACALRLGLHGEGRRGGERLQAIGEHGLRLTSGLENFCGQALLDRRAAPGR